MTKEEALAFLREHQPMPPDNEISEELIVEYDEVRKYFIEHPDIEALPLLLNSFGDGSGFGVYQLVDEAITKFPPEIVVPHLVKALESNQPGVRFWSAQIAIRFPSPELTLGLSELLNCKDEDTRFASATALQFVDDPRVDEVFRKVLETSDDPDLCEQITEALLYRQEKNRNA